MFSYVYAVLRHEKQALYHAEKCWEFTKSFKMSRSDLAYAYEALVRINVLAVIMKK